MIHVRTAFLKQFFTSEFLFPEAFEKVLVQFDLEGYARLVLCFLFEIG